MKPPGVSSPRKRGSSGSSAGGAAGNSVIPAQAGIQLSTQQRSWVPAAACPREGGGGNDTAGFMRRGSRAARWSN